MHTSGGRNYHPHFTDEDDWGSETWNYLQYKSGNWGGSVPDFKVHRTPDVPMCCQIQCYSKALMKRTWVVGLPFAVMPRWLAEFSPNTVDEACCFFKCSVTSIQKQKATYFFLYISHHSLGQWFSKSSPRISLSILTQLYSAYSDLEVQILRPHSRPTESETLGVGPSNLCLNKSSGDAVAWLSLKLLI